MSRDFDLAAVEVQPSEQAQQASKHRALQQRPIVAEREMVRAANDGAHAQVGRLAVVDALDLLGDAPVDRIFERSMIRKQEHERHGQASLDDAAKQPAVDVDACRAAWVLRTELRRLRAAKRMADDAD